MKKLTKDYFASGSVALVGYSSKKDSFCKAVYKELTAEGIKVYPVNKNKDSVYDIEVYYSLSEIETLPEIAYILTSKLRVSEAVSDVINSGIKKILIQSKRLIDDSIVEACESAGIELTVGCPLMAAGRGLHRFHGFLAGVK